MKCVVSIHYCIQLIKNMAGLNQEPDFHRLLLYFLAPTLTGGVLACFSHFFTHALPTQDHLLLPAGLLVLQRLPAGLCPTAEGAATAAAPHHLCHPPPGDLPETAVGPPAPARGPSQPVSRRIHPDLQTRRLYAWLQR